MDNINKGEKAYNECIAKGICSISPTLSSVHAVILVYLEELSFYLLELDTLGIKNEQIKQDIIDAYSAIISNADLGEENLNRIISTLYQELFQAKELYKGVCERNNIKANFLKSPIKISKQFNVTEAIKQGQRYFKQRAKILSSQEKILMDLLILILNSICLYIVELQGMGVDIYQYYRHLLSAFSVRNFAQISAEKIEYFVDKFVKIDHELMNILFEERKKAFGELDEVDVLHSAKQGKAILVAGANLKDLERLLEATKDRGIDVYTHGQMISAHAFSKLKSYPHLVGHWGKGSEYYMSDFSQFPGTILLTTLSLYKVERLFRGGIYTIDKIGAKGISKVNNYDFEPLIHSALMAEGFLEQEAQKIVKIGLDESEFIAKLNEIAQKVEQGEINHMFTIGISNRTPSQKDYFDEFLKQLNDDCFVLSFSYFRADKNVLRIGFDYAFPFLYKALHMVSEKKQFEQLKPNIYITRCEPHTVANLFMLRKLGVNNIFFEGCSPNFANPVLVDYVKEVLKLRGYSSPHTDFQICMES